MIHNRTWQQRISLSAINRFLLLSLGKHSMYLYILDSKTFIATTYLALLLSAFLAGLGLNSVG